MRPAKTKYQLWQIMLAIAVLAGLFAVFGVVGTVAILVVISVVCLPILLAPSGRKLLAAEWVCSLYPLLILGSLYATWLTAWCVLGHRPRSSLDDPKSISPIVDVPYLSTFLLLYGVVFILLLCPVLLSAEVADIISKGRDKPLKEAARRLVVPILWGLFLWVSSIVLLRWDPLRVGDWYMD